jgi:uracil phosphoribosyltransferase
MTAYQVSGKKLCFISILRAGSGILEGMLDLVPAARIGHVGLYRDPVTKEPVEYYFKVPDDMENRLCVVVDPMLATGHSAAAAVTKLLEAGAKHIKFVCLIAAPEGIAAFHAIHPTIPIYTGAIDRQLDDHAYIRPGLGDAGDRIFGTK